ncbi:hypothetical protein ACF09Z_34695 [Streptomyces erythrochromogenes]|uniref:hypothetical protein n=1 Tax=Streptomyces erythrochromogenes TaxID=285574 RepID=UPI0036F99D04
MTAARGITVGRLAALVVLVLAVAVAATLLIMRATDRSGAGGTGGDDRPSRASSKGATPGPTNEPAGGPAGGTPYAYTTEQELVLVRGDRPPTRVPRVFDLADPHRNKVVWSHDGHRVAFFSDDELLDRREDTRLITVDARTGEVLRLPCPGCHDLAPVGDHDVMVLSNESGATRAFRIDLDRPTAPRTKLDNGRHWQPQLLGATPTHVLTGRYELSGGDPGMELRLNDLNTAGITVYPRFDSNAYMPAALAAVGGGQRIAVAARHNPGGCTAPFPIHVLGPKGEVGGSDQSAALPPGYIAGVTGGIDVSDLWWGPDQHLYATISAWTCDKAQNAQDGKKRPHRPATLFRLDGDRWVSAGDQPATVVRPLDRDTRMVLVIPDCNAPVERADAITYCNTGSLYREEAGKRTKVADDVLSLSAPATAS